MRAVFRTDLEPAAVLLPQVIRQLAYIHQLVRVQLGLLVGADDDVGSGPDVRGHCRLRPQLLEVLAVDTHLDASELGEPARVRQELIFVALHEALPAQHAQGRAFLRLVLERCSLRRPRLHEPAGRASSSGRRGRGQEATSGESVHAGLLLVLIQSQLSCPGFRSSRPSTWGEAERVGRDQRPASANPHEPPMLAAEASTKTNPTSCASIADRRRVCCLDLASIRAPAGRGTAPAGGDRARLNGCQRPVNFAPALRRHSNGVTADGTLMLLMFCSAGRIWPRLRGPR